MRVQTRASAEISASPECVFDLVVDHSRCPHLFRSWGPIPGVVQCEPWAAHGNANARPRRKLKLSDGSTHEEEMLAHGRPHHYQYRWLNPPAVPLNFIVRTAEASWEFQTLQGGARTLLSLTYEFELSVPLAYPFALVLRALFYRWMVAALERVQQTSLDATRPPSP